MSLSHNVACTLFISPVFNKQHKFRFIFQHFSINTREHKIQITKIHMLSYRSDVQIEMYD